MDGTNEMLSADWPLLVYGGLVLIVVLGMLGLSYVLGPRGRRDPNEVPYEAGMLPTGSARPKLSVDFYLVAVFFVIFDLEAVFVFAWATSVRELGWIGYLEIVLFIAVPLAGLMYIWREGALDWGPRSCRGDADDGEDDE